MTSKLILNADDYGYSPKFNRGILELARLGIISSVSVMIRRNFIKVSDLNNLENISIGLHLELKEKDTQKEILKQLEKFQRKFGKLPSHLDGHKHLHLTKHNLPKVIRLAKKYNLPVRSYKDTDRKAIKKSGIKTPNNFISWHPKRKNILYERLSNAPAEISELVCHPGYHDKNSKLAYNIQREKELEILKSRAFKKAVSRFKLINYSEF